MSELLNYLNEEQRLPVEDTEGAVLVIAGAGSGKTRVLTSRIAYLVKEKNVFPSRILAITFTNKAADEMKERISLMVGSVSDMWVSTIHSMCARMLRQNISYLGYDKNFTIYSDVERDRVLKRIISTVETESDKLLKNLKWHISNAKSLGLSPRAYMNEMSDAKDIGKYCLFYEEYEKELKKSNALDFDDLLIKTRDLLANYEEVRNYYSDKFQYIHIDEFQDTNTTQYEIICLLSKNHGNIFAVGDDDQSIYGWRGAEIKNILDFEKDFEGAKVYKLERNYRSTKRILNLANAIIKNNTVRKKKVLWTNNEEGVKAETYSASDEANEAMYAAVQIKSLIARGYKPSDFAVLTRINALSRSFEQEFVKYNIPYKIFGGVRFYERKEIKDLLAYFRLLVNPFDTDALLRIINVPRRGIGEKTIELLAKSAMERGVSLYDSILDLDTFDLPAATKKRLSTFKDTLKDLILDKENVLLSELLDKVLARTQFLSLFEANTEENYSRKANIVELKNAMIEFEKQNYGATLEDFLISITLSSDVDEMDEGEYVTLATIHSVKGLEFRVVFVAGLEENIFPISRAMDAPGEMEEERRLMYVAITRARERLFFTLSSNRFLFGERQYTIRSRFLGELAEELGISGQQQREQGRYTSSYVYKNKNDEISSSSYSGSFSLGGAAQKIMEGQKPKQQVSNDKVSEYAVGKKVRHVKFGEGVIVAVRGAGASVIADVAFKGVGVKSLSVKFAPMELVKN